MAYHSLALSLVLGLAACGESPASVPAASTVESAEPAPAPEPEPEPAPAEEPALNVPTIESVTFTGNYIETAATADDTINSPSASSNVASVTLSDGTVITAKDGGVLTLVVEGNQYDILDYLEKGTVLGDGAYSFESTAGTVAYSEMGKFMNMAGQTAQYPYRSALQVNGDGIVENETIPALLGHVDAYSATALRGGRISSYGPFFNGIIVDSAPSNAGSEIAAYE